MTKWIPASGLALPGYGILLGTWGWPLLLAEWAFSSGKGLLVIHGEGNPCFCIYSCATSIPTNMIMLFINE